MMMMMTLKENTANSMSQPVHYETNANDHSYSRIGHGYHHRHNPWDKPISSTFDYQSTPYSVGTMPSTGAASSVETKTKSNSSYPSFDTASNLPNSSSNFHRRHTESTLSTSTSIYSSSTAYHPSTSSFHYPQSTAHYHPSELFLGWNHGPSLIRTHSASYRDYPSSTPFPPYNSNNSSTSQSTTRPLTGSISTLNPNNNYPSFFNMISPMNFSFPPPPPPPPPLHSSMASNSNSHKKRPSSSIQKRPRLTAHLRNEIQKLKTSKPTIFVGEVQQSLLRNGVCTVQTLPSATVIQRILNGSTKSLGIVKDEIKDNVNTVLQTVYKSSSVSICLSPCPSPALSDGQPGSECSICLESYRSGQEVSILSCSHEYHSSCIKEWMIKNRSCPMCRKNIHNQPQFVTLLI